MRMAAPTIAPTIAPTGDSKTDTIIHINNLDIEITAWKFESI